MTRLSCCCNWGSDVLWSRVINDDNTPWCNQANDKLILQSGQFSGTVKTSQSIGTIDVAPTGIRWDGTNTPWCGIGDKKLYVTSGQFTSTIKTSEDVSATGRFPEGLSWDGTNTPWYGEDASSICKLMLQSGKFSSTIKTSLAISSSLFNDDGATSWDGSDTIIAARRPPSSPHLWLLSGQFTSTVKTSQSVAAQIDGSGPNGVCWDGINTLYCGIGGTFPSQSGRLYVQSGKFSSTIKASLIVGTSVVAQPRGIATNIKTDS